MRLPLSLIAIVLFLYGSAQEKYLFVGTYTGQGSKGIYVYRFNTVTGNATWVSNTDSGSTQNPSYVTLSPGNKFLYSVYEVNEQNSGEVAAYSFDKNTGKLRFLNKQASGGGDPCFITSTSSNKWVLTGNYSGGSLAAYPVNKDGSLKPSSQVIKHTGKGKIKGRQDEAHVHATFFTPTEDYVLVPDLGLDKLMVYKFNAAAAEPLQPATPAFATTLPGSGPRHLTFSKDNKFVYVIQELSGSVAVYKYNKGKLSFIQDIITHPKEYKGTPGSADIHISPDGNFLYASNRGEENTISIFSINKTSGKLSLVGIQSTMGRGPRNFMIDPAGNFLLAANHYTNNIVIFRINKKTGLLTETGKQIEIPNPVCLKMQ